MKKKTSRTKKKKAKKQDPLDRDMSFVFDKPKKWKQFGELFELTPQKKEFALKMSAKLLKQYKKLAKAKD